MKFQKFFTNTIEEKFIKSLLYNTQLPLYKSVVTGDYIVIGMLYVYDGNIIRCSKSGYISEDETEDSAEYIFIESYVFGNKLLKNTQNFVSTYSYYDSDTHKYLGEYLRAIKSYYKLNLMGYYNCFNNKFINTFYFDEDKIVQKSTTTYKIAQIPIKYNTTYTIAIDSDSKVIVRPVLLSHGTSVTYTKLNSEGNAEYVNLYEKLAGCEVKGMTKLTDPVAYAQTLTFKKPVTYRINNKVTDDRELSDVLALEENEKNLYLMIQLSASNTSSIVVLEGDYTNISARRIFNLENAQNYLDMSTEELNDLLQTDLSLLQLNTKVSYAFTYRLIEYLLLNLITSEDTIYKNIKYVQDLVSSYNTAYELADFKVSGIFDNYLRVYLYESYICSKKSKRLDLNGFVDKDTEEFIIKKAQLNG